MPDFTPIITYNNPTFQVSDVLKAAYRLGHALKHPGQGLSGSEFQEGLDTLNAMVDGWKIEGPMIIYTRRTEQQMTMSQKVYSVGPGQDFDLERPEQIHRAGFLVGTAPNIAEIPMTQILTFEEFSAIVVKDVGSSIPLAYYYQASVPYGAFRVWPVPNVGSSIAIYTPQLLSEFLTVDDVLEMPKGYREMLMYNLAVRVHQLYPSSAPLDATVLGMAAQYKARVMASQAKGMFIGSDPAAMQEGRQAKYYGGQPRAWQPY